MVALVEPFKSNESPFAETADEYLAAGYSIIPVMPRDKVPAEFKGGHWTAMGNWNSFSRKRADDFTVRLWKKWEDANIGVVLGTMVGGYQVVAIDFDTDDARELEALQAELPPSPMKKRGARGYTAFYRAPADLRTKRYRVPDKESIKPNAMRTVLEILTGNAPRQTVMPPSMHPCGRPYEWHDCQGIAPMQQLPVITLDQIEKLEDTLGHLGWNEKTACEGRRTANDNEAGEVNPFRETNNIALANLDRWVGELGLPKLKRLRNGSWEAVPVWRPSNEGNATEKRKPNLKFHASGIKDMGADVGYTPTDVVMEAFNWSFDPAFSWLRSRLGLDDESHCQLPPLQLGRDDDGNLYDQATGEIITPGRGEAPSEGVEVLGGLRGPATVVPAAEQDNARLRTQFVVERHGEPSPFPAASWFIKKWLPDSGVALLAGQSEAGKTSVAVYIATGLATETEVFGRPVTKRVGTLFLIGEAQGYLRNRLDSAASNIANVGEDVDLAKLPISFTVGTIATPTDRQAFIAEAREEAALMRANHGVDLGMVVIDTLAACCRFEDENSSSETTKAMTSLDEISRELGCLVLPLAHYGKTAEAGVRGSSAIKASADAVLVIEVKQNNHVITHRQIVVSKLRGGATGTRNVFELQPVELGTDADGDPIEDLIVVPTNDGALFSVPREQREPRLAPSAQAYLKAFEVVFSEAVEIRPYGQDGAAQKAVDREKIRDEFYAAYPADGDTEEKRKETKKKAFSNGEKLLKRSSKIETRNMENITYVWKIHD